MIKPNYTDVVSVELNYYGDPDFVGSAFELFTDQVATNDKHLKLYGYSLGSEPIEDTRFKDCMVVFITATMYDGKHIWCVTHTPDGENDYVRELYDETAMSFCGDRFYNCPKDMIQGLHNLGFCDVSELVFRRGVEAW